MNRTQKTIKNLIVALIGQFLGIIISFISRIYFIKILGAEYLGINGLFTNILQMLTLVELGIGPAITYALYKPLALNEEEKIKTIMKLYKKIYIAIGSFIIIGGIIITPFINFFINESPNISDNIYIIFLLFVINAGISYFYSYKRDLIIADQKRYIATIYRYTFYLVLNVLQIIFLTITKNYYIFLILQILSTLLENIFINIKANKLYPFLKNKQVKALDQKTKKSIVKNIKAMIFHKVGGLIVNSTDNILISKIIGVISVGLYSNYYLITNALNTIIAQFFSSITASVGNLNALESKNKSLETFKKVNFINFWIIYFSSICFLCLANPFINLWLGEELVFQQDIIIILTLCFYFSGMRKSVLAFKDSFGLYWEDRYKPIIEIIINLVISIILGKKIGIQGIFIGTIISTITTCTWIEPLVLYKHGFNSSTKQYFTNYIKNFLFTLIVGTITFMTINVIKVSTIPMFLIKAIISILIPNIIFIIFFHKSTEFKYCIDLGKNILKKIIKK